jgi:hypothetical protein
MWNVKNKKSTSAASLPGNPEMLLRFAGHKSKQHLRVPKGKSGPTGVGIQKGQRGCTTPKTMVAAWPAKRLKMQRILLLPEGRSQFEQR